MDIFGEPNTVSCAGDLKPKTPRQMCKEMIIYGERAGEMCGKLVIGNSDVCWNHLRCKHHATKRHCRICRLSKKQLVKIAACMQTKPVLLTGISKVRVLDRVHCEMMCKQLEQLDMLAKMGAFMAAASTDTVRN